MLILRNVIEVTADDIRHGKRDSSRDCPIARAIKRRSCSPDNVAVTVTRLIKGNKEVYDLPQEARDFIFKFDHGITVKPFSFEIYGAGL